MKKFNKIETRFGKWLAQYPLGLILLVCLVSFWVLFYGYASSLNDNQSVLQQNSEEERIQKSLSNTPVWNTERAFILTQTNGSSTLFEVAKFTCCGTGGVVTRDGTIVLGYLNTVETSQVGTTSRVRVPEIDTAVLVHELFHLVTTQPTVLARCPALGESRLQEEIAYNIGGLYEQIRSLDEDGYIKLAK